MLRCIEPSAIGARAKIESLSAWKPQGFPVNGAFNEPQARSRAAMFARHAFGEALREGPRTRSERSAAMAKLNVGDRAPDFTLASESGETVSLARALERGPVVLIFYPMDNTPGCTAQLCAARDDAAAYAAAGASVYGVNNGSARSHAAFKAKHGLAAPLLVDARLVVASAYDSVLGFGLLKFVNRTVVGIVPDGTIAFYERGTPATGEILDSLSSRGVAAKPATRR